MSRKTVRQGGLQSHTAPQGHTAQAPACSLPGQSTAFKLEESLQMDSSNWPISQTATLKPRRRGVARAPTSLRQQLHPWSPGLKPACLRPAPQQTSGTERDWGHGASAELPSDTSPPC